MHFFLGPAFQKLNYLVQKTFFFVTRKILKTHDFFGISCSILFRKLGLAVGVACSGSGLGGMVFAPVIFYTNKVGVTLDRILGIFEELEEQQGRNIYLSRSEYLSTTMLP